MFISANVPHVFLNGTVMGNVVAINISVRYKCYIAMSLGLLWLLFTTVLYESIQSI